MIRRIHLILPPIGLFLLLTCKSVSQLPDYHVQLFDERFGIRTDMEWVVQDKSGFIWLMYTDRVQRFDGEHLDEFFINDRLSSILVDHEDNLWITSRAEVYIFVKSKKGFDKVDIDRTNHPVIGAVFQTPGNEVWVYSDIGFYSYDKKTSKFLFVKNEKFITPTPLVIRRFTFNYFENYFFYATKDTLWSHDVTTGRKLHFPVSELSALHAISNHQVIVSTWKSETFLFDFNEMTRGRILPRNFLHHILDDFLSVSGALNLGNHRHLLSTSKGLLEFNSMTGDLSLKQLYYKGRPLSIGGRITDLYMDSNQKVWACSEYSLITFDPLGASFGLIRNPEATYSVTFNNQIRNFAPDENENLWIASFGAIIHWDLQKNNFELLLAEEGAQDRMNHPSIRGIGYDGENVIIGQANRGVWLYNPKTKMYRRPFYEPGAAGKSTKTKLEKDFVDQLYKLQNGDYFIAARDGGYVLHSKSYIIRQVNFPGSKENLNFCYQDKFKQVWVGTYQGLYCLDSNLVYQYSIKEGFGTWVLRCLYQWDDTEYILGAQGLYTIRIYEGKIETNVLDHYFDEIFIHSIYRDKSDRLWLATDEGIYRYNRKTGYVESFDQFDNLQGDTYFPNSMYVNKAGMLFFGGTNGINYFYPDKIQTRKDSLQVSLLKVAVNQDDTSYHNRSDLLSLKSSENSIVFEYIAPYYGNTNRLQYRYRLEGVSRDWNNVGHNNTVRFSSLQPGHYTFNVAASINGIDWFENKEPVAFNIAFPFWQTWWFILFMILLTGWLIFYFLKKRIHVIREKEKVKREYERRIAEVEMHALRAQMNPHFMFNSLNSINNFILKNDPDNASGYLTKFSRLMRLILDNSRSEWVLLENELKALELYIEMEVVRFDHVFEYEIVVDPNVNVDTTYVPPMIVQPYVENAIWHGLLHRTQSGGKLCIRLWREGDRLHISIEDNGVGREEANRQKSKSATKHKSHGMKITEERIEIVNRIYNVNAKVQIEDLAGHNGSVGGTKVSLTLQDKMYDSHHSG